MSQGQFEPIARSPLYEQVVERLRTFIDEQRMQPGDRLMSERELAERLGVSRTSVRQALTALRVLGLVDIRHGDGVYLLRTPAEVIPSLALEMIGSETDHPMIWEVREGIEAQTARLAARRRNREDLDRMEAALDAMAQSIGEGGEGVVGDRHFHRAVAEAAHNPLLGKLVEQLSETIDRTSAASLSQPGRAPISLEAHREILAAIRQQDETLAAERMRAHIVVSGESVYSRSALS